MNVLSYTLMQINTVCTYYSKLLSSNNNTLDINLIFVSLL